MKQSEPARRGSGQGPTDPGLLARPLDFISEDHLRERQICTEIDRLVAAETFDRPAGEVTQELLDTLYANEQLVSPQAPAVTLTLQIPRC